MRILWIVNTLFPAPSEEMGLPVPVVGGWMYSLLKQLSKDPQIELSVATTTALFDFMNFNIDGIKYFILPCKDNTKYDHMLEDFWGNICVDFKPDIIHIHGTEFAHGLACMRKLPTMNYIVSIQGLVGIIARYYFAGIGYSDIFRNITFRDFIRMDTLWHQKKKFEARGEFEEEYIRRTHNIIGRTQWDMVHTQSINPEITYHFCNESLRNGFYKADKWSSDICDKNTIFLSQAGYPIKGLHQVIKAVSIIKNEYPDIRVRIGGTNLTDSHTFRNRLRISGYAKFIKRLIKKNDLEDCIVFLGSLSEDKIIREYQKANVFLCPSSIENSPNSLGEAQFLGTPVIAAFVGGVPDMVIHNETGLLYRFEEVEMLSENIRKIFNNNDIASTISKAGIEIAKTRHNKNRNLRELLKIYDIACSFNKSIL